MEIPGSVSVDQIRHFIRQIGFFVEQGVEIFRQKSHSKATMSKFRQTIRHNDKSVETNVEILKGM